MPLIGICVVKGAVQFGLVHDNPLYQFVLLLQFAVPPAINIGTFNSACLSSRYPFNLSTLFKLTCTNMFILFKLWHGRDDNSIIWCWRERVLCHYVVVLLIGFCVSHIVVDLLPVAGLLNTVDLDCSCLQTARWLLMDGVPYFRPQVLLCASSYQIHTLLSNWTYRWLVLIL